MTERITVHQEDKPIYEIVMESSFERLGNEFFSLGTSGRRICIVSDSNVAALYLEEVQSCLRPVCGQVDAWVFPAGEEQKTLDTVRSLYEYLILHHYDRSDFLVALGGGVVGDLCGFTAATYLRGIRFIQVPTSLLAQVDSSIGGKTGVDFDAYKNMVGAFHMPSLVYVNTATLRTLDAEQFSSGMGEIVKHGLIKDSAYYGWLKEQMPAIMAREAGVCAEMVLGSDRIKRDVVEQDPTEKGERALLNFGHTLGHAIEKQMGFRLNHGQCVALGCLAAAWISAERGLISKAEVEDIRSTLRSFGLPVTIAGMKLDPEAVVCTAKSDKKMDRGQVKFILLKSPGCAFIDRSVNDDEMRSALRWLAGGSDEK
ncbi:MAG: 3-dehydroquinate synthase [Clostridiales bacterium]|nr:3-dehydroquinate synthase [Clostridiales bacterium]